MELPKAKQLAQELMRKHGLQDWTFHFDKAIRRFGMTKIKVKTISLSARLTELNNEEKVKDTILHEIAHALTPKAGHNWKWKMTAKSIGGNAQRTYSAETVVVTKPKYIATCSTCGKVVTKYRKTSPSACGACCKKYNSDRYSEKYILLFEPYKN